MARISEQIDIERFDDTLKKRALESSNPKWAELWAKRKGLLVDKQQVKNEFEIAPNDYLNITHTVIHNIREGIKQHGGICPVCGKPQGVPVKVCPDTEQEHGTDGKVGSVGLPTKSSG